MSEKEPTFHDAEIAELLKELPGWYFEDGWIRRVYKTDGWPTTLMLVNAIGYCAGTVISFNGTICQRISRPGNRYECQ